MKTIKVFVALTFVALASFQTLAQSTAKTIATKINDVTVFMTGAQVTENGSVQLKEGENIFRITDLTAYLDPNSIQVEGNAGYTIMSVRHQINYTLDQSSSPMVKAVTDSLEEARFKQQELTGLKNVVIQEKTLLENNRKIGGENSTLVVEDLQDMANFFRKRFQELEYRWIELGDQEKKNNLEISRLSNQLNSMNARKGTNPSEILVTLIAPKATTTNLKVSYVVRNAGWYPVYDLRAEDVNSPVEFVYRAKVYQSTGRDWEKVNLTISTGNPSVGGQIPTLYPWYVNVYEPMVQTGYKRAEADYSMNATPSVAYDSEVTLEEVQITSGSGKYKPTAADYTTVQNNTVNTEFKISVPYDIPSDNQQYDVTMQTQSLKAQYAHITIPKIDNDAFLRAQITDWAQYSLLPGESNIYFKGTFVGKGYIL